MIDITPTYDQHGALLSITATDRDMSAQYTPAELLSLPARLAAAERRVAVLTMCAQMARARAERVTAERDALRAVVQRVARKAREGRG